MRYNKTGGVSFDSDHKVFIYPYPDGFIVHLLLHYPRLELLAMTYGIMLVHELFHLGAAILIGLRPASMAFIPFGAKSSAEK